MFFPLVWCVFKCRQSVCVLEISMCIFNLISVSPHGWWEMGKTSLSFKINGCLANTSVHLAETFLQQWLNVLRIKENVATETGSDSSWASLVVYCIWDMTEGFICYKWKTMWAALCSDGRSTLTAWSHWRKLSRTTKKQSVRNNEFHCILDMKYTPEHSCFLKAQVSPLTISFHDISGNIRSLECISPSLSVFRHIEDIGETGSRLEQSERSDISFYLSSSLVSGSCRPSVLNCTRLGCSNNIIQLSFYPQAMNNLWTVNHCCGVSPLDQSPQGSDWERPSRLHYILFVQIEIISSSKRLSMCSSHLRPCLENTTLNLIH